MLWISLYLFRTKLLAANHLITKERLNFTLNRKHQHFCLQLWHYYHQQIILFLIHNLFSGKGNLYITWTTETLELILGELHVSMYCRHQLNKMMLFQLSVFYYLHSTWTNIQLHLKFHRIVIELTKFHNLHNQKPVPNHIKFFPHAFFWLIDFKTQSVTLKAAFSVGIPFLKTNYSVVSMLFACRCYAQLSWVIWLEWLIMI